jgi:predicted PurR-regulated permease PerM
LTFVPKDYKIEVEILIRRINSVLGGYLRGQIFLVFFVSLA